MHLGRLPLLLTTLLLPSMLVSLLAVPSASADDLTVRRVSLFFANKRIETTVARNTPGLVAYADILLSNAGLLEGFWEVDGRPASRFSMHAAGGRVLQIQVPKEDAFPTFSPGTHVVKLVITRPRISFPAPSVVYFVLPHEKEAAPSIGLHLPEDSAVIDAYPVRFSWENEARGQLFVIMFTELPGGRAVYSAVIETAEFPLDEDAARALFRAGVSYAWKITAIDREKGAVAESASRRFSIRRKK